MKKFNKSEIEDIALRYAYNKKSLTQKNVECFIAGFVDATNRFTGCNTIIGRC